MQEMQRNDITVNQLLSAIGPILTDVLDGGGRLTLNLVNRTGKRHATLYLENATVSKSPKTDATAVTATLETDQGTMDLPNTRCITVYHLIAAYGAFPIN